jgi:DUF971 family protein
MTIRPTELKIVGTDKLLIGWSDGQKRQIRFRELRDRCPCATCREKRTQQETRPTLLPVLTDAEMRPLSILGMKPVGNYAYAIHFSDGHDTGIFTYELLRELGEET